MRLYIDPSHQYLAVPDAMAFTPTNGYRACFDGRDVPDVICRALVRQYGGQVLDAAAIAGSSAARLGLSQTISLHASTGAQRANQDATG